MWYIYGSKDLVSVLFLINDWREYYALERQKSELKR